MLSLDTETNGMDFKHGSAPFFVTTCTDEGVQTYWEWEVDPLTRKPIVPQGDIYDIGQLVMEHASDSSVVMHNGKFDIAALNVLNVWRGWDIAKLWSSLKDTLVASHILASNQPHGLNDLGVQYLGVDHDSNWEYLKVAVIEARRLAGHEFPDWALAKSGRPDMPSCDSAWGCDYWVPRAYARATGMPHDHSWHTVLRDYANADSELTMALWQVMSQQLESRKLTKIFAARMDISRLTYQMQDTGVTVDRTQLNVLTKLYAGEKAKLEATCYEVAKTHDYPLNLPKGTINNNLRTFLLDTLELTPVYSKKSKTGAPCFDKNAMQYYLDTLEKGPSLTFVESLMAKNSRGISLGYMASYCNFMLPTEHDGYFKIYPSLNQTGTRTTRLSSQNPNEQQISKKKVSKETLRSCFGPAPGREWWSMDAMNIELRLPAYESGEPDLISLFEQSDVPPFYGSNHIMIFSILHPDKWERGMREVGSDKCAEWCKVEYKEWYQRTKNGNFALIYGAMDREDGNGTADQAYGVPGGQSRIKQRFQKQEALNQKYIKLAEKWGYVETLPDRTVDPERGYPLLCTRTERGQILPTVPLNYHVQGSAGWWMMKAMGRCDGQLAEWARESLGKWHGHIVMTVHDELVFDFPKAAHPVTDPRRSNLGRVKKIRRLMEESGADFGIPTPVSCEYHEKNWANGISV